MIGNNNKLKCQLVLTALLMCAVSLPLYAVQHEPTPTQTGANIKESPELPLTVQDFQEGNLSIQFRYDKDQKLSAIRLQNLGNTPLHIRVLKESYVLGPKDRMVFNPPALGRLKIIQNEHSHIATAMDILFPDRFSKHIIFKLPPNQDSEVGKQVNQPQQNQGN